MKVKGSQAGWGFWLKWVLASTVGVVVGSIMVMVIGLLIYVLLEELIGRAETDILLEPGWLTVLFDLVIGSMLGIGVGILQWLVLQGRVSRVGWWVLASAAAGAIQMVGDLESYSELLSFGLLLRFTGIVALGGAVAGILQWLVLRGKVSRAGWWVLASTVGWGLSIAVMRALEWGVTDDCSLVSQVVSGVVLGAITGAALVWLLRQPVPEAQLDG
jgi:hypothetical protein